MRSLINHLIQLQELTLIREEQKVTDGSHHFEQLDASIKEMTAKLPAETATLFGKLHKKDHIVIAPVTDGSCALCRMQLPVSLAQAVRMEKVIHSCPNCARMLFHPEGLVRRTSKATRRMDPPKIGISRFSSHTLIIPKLEAETREDAIRELAHKMEVEGFVDKAETLVAHALEREATLSTSVHHGLAFPHVRGVEGGGLALAVGLSPKGIDWGGNDNPAKIIFFIVIPTSASAFYLKLLAGLAETFGKPEARKLLQAEKDQEKIWKVLTKLTRATIK